jgi:hypothetical protein
VDWQASSIDVPVEQFGRRALDESGRRAWLPFPKQ